MDYLRTPPSTAKQSHTTSAPNTMQIVSATVMETRPANPRVHKITPAERRTLPESTRARYQQLRPRILLVEVHLPCLREQEALYTLGLEERQRPPQPAEVNQVLLPLCWLWVTAMVSLLLLPAFSQVSLCSRFSKASCSFRARIGVLVFCVCSCVRLERAFLG
jgi:hypothetical protein